MSTTTDKLALFKYDPSTDGAQTFNIQKALNDNWDKLDDAVKEILITLANKAPGGFGLGGNAKVLTASDNVDDLKASGWYTWSWEPNKQPAGLPSEAEFHVGLIRVDGASGPNASQTIYFVKSDPSENAGDQCVIQRMGIINGTWNAWEWVNPPMTLGTEYRTTERYMGRSVYKKLVALGEALSTKGTKEIFPFGEDYISGTYNVFSVDAHLSSSANDGGWTITTPHFNIVGELITDIRFSGVRIDFYSTGQAGYYGFALLKYTKEAD